MKKIKKGLCALSLAICGGTAFTVPMFSGCGGPAQQELENSGYEFVSIDGGSGNYYQNDVFSLEGRNMTIKDKATNQNIVIPLTNDMIIGGLGSIDMTTGGEKEITVVYDGKEYSFVITVNEKTQASFREQLAALLSKYQNDSIKSVDFSMNWAVVLFPIHSLSFGKYP